MKKQTGKVVIDRTCVIVSKSDKNQKEIIDELISVGGECSNYEHEKKQCFDTGHKVIYIYGYTGIVGDKERFMFCICHSVARNEIPCGELEQRNIKKYFLNVRTIKSRDRLLSIKNADIYAPHPQWNE